MKKFIFIFVIFSFLILSSCSSVSELEMIGPSAESELEPTPSSDNSEHIENASYSVAHFAGGCFWCTESAFEKLDGVIEVYSGFSGGVTVDPSYAEASSGTTGHTETVEVHYDETVVSFEELVHLLLLQIDPTDATGSFVDRGDQYRSAIFYSSESEMQIAEQVLSELATLNLYEGNEFSVEVLPFEAFYFAEDYHQDYHTKNPIRYSYYRGNSGRDQFLEEIWTQENLDLFESFLYSEDITLVSNNVAAKVFEKPSDAELREILTELEYHVTQESGTERSFSGEYDAFCEVGIYVDILSGEALYASFDKYDSKTGWPSFTKPLVEENIQYVEDKSFFYSRIEIRSNLADSHLGHVFADGPTDKGGMRYCMNSAALRFVPIDNMESEGYAEFLELFE